MKRQEKLLWAALTLLLLTIGLQFWQAFAPKTAGFNDAAGAELDNLKNYAAALKSNQIYGRAADKYDEYVQRASLTDNDKAKIDFNTANMLLDQLGDAEGALAHYLRITDLYKGVDGEILKESRKLAAECLEKMGRSGAAEQQLVESSRLTPGDATPEAKVDEKDILAAIGTRTSITRTEFDEAWKELPPYAKEQRFKGREGREKFLQEMLSLRLFADSARRKGYDRDVEVRRRLRAMEENLLAGKLYSEEIAGKILLPDSDLNLFYEAHKDHYKDPATVEIAHIQTADATRCLAAKAAIEKGSPFADVAKSYSTDTRSAANGGKLGKISMNRAGLEKDPNFDPLNVAIPGIGKSKELAAAAFALQKEGEIAGPIQSQAGFHLITLISRTPEKEKTFEEAKQQVESELKAQREEEKRKELVAELIKANQVRVYAERLGE